MTWSFQATGHTPDPGSGDPQPWKVVEEDLVGMLAQILSRPEYGTHHWEFAGNFVAEQFPPVEPTVIPETPEETIARLQAENDQLRAAVAAGPEQESE